eukprot:scaffold201808_cov35-Attheya_sp.AAC.1
MPRNRKSRYRPGLLPIPVRPVSVTRVKERRRSEHRAQNHHFFIVMGACRPFPAPSSSGSVPLGPGPRFSHVVSLLAS